MSTPAQERRSCLWLAAAILVVPLLAGCAGRFDAASLGIDDSIRTGSVHSAGIGDESGISADARMIRLAVAGVELPAREGGTFAWANAGTGAKGTISRIEEVLEAGNRCRSFQASRQDFDGIMLYRGEVCRHEGEDWRLRRFEPVES